MSISNGVPYSSLTILSEQEVISEQGKIKKSSPASVFDKVKKCEQEGKNLQNSYLLQACSLNRYYRVSDKSLWISKSVF